MRLAVDSIKPIAIRSDFLQACEVNSPKYGATIPMSAMDQPKNRK